MAARGNARTELAAALAADRIELHEMIRTGDNTEVHSGLDRRRGVPVIVKVARGAARASLETEARALARLGEHPHILGVQLVGCRDTGPSLSWLVTDEAAGGSLHERIGASARVVLGWATQLAEALAHAHANGVVHADVTPSNVMLDSRDEVLLGDFGSAVLLADAPGPRRPTGHTPAYAAPERRRSAPATPADDVYGLAATAIGVCGDHHQLPRAQLRLLQRCLGEAACRPDARSLAERLAL